MPDIAGSYINIDNSNITNKKSKVRQLVDIVQTDIASSGTLNTRKSYEVFVSGVSDQNITSSLYQTVFDQDFALGTANPLFEVSVGSLLEESGTTLTVNGISSGLSRDAGGKIIGFANETPMMREKINIYRQFAQNLLGSPDSSFFLPHSATAEDADQSVVNAKKKIRGAIFICFRRLFTRDNIHKGSFGLKLQKSATKLYSDFLATTGTDTGTKITNIDSEVTTTLQTNEANPFVVIDDALSATNLTISPVSGEVSTLKDSSGTHVGNIYYDCGIIVLDVERVFDADQIIRGIIDSVRKTTKTLSATTGPFYVHGDDSGGNPSGFYYPLYTAATGAFTDTISITPTGGSATDFYYDSDSNPAPSLGVATRPSGIPLHNTSSSTFYSDVDTAEVDGKSLFNNKLYPNLWVSGTVDEVLDHVCMTRFGRGNNSSITFRNETFINSSFIFCRAAPTQLNYSTNPTYTDDNGDIVAIDRETNDSFSFVTTIGLYDAAGELLAVAKTSRPIEKNPETDLSIRIRLDY
tara:strand:+ start:838 stop:2406 length:1569 start_codon:yes stop_codon:yes gene_type:complete